MPTEAAAGEMITSVLIPQIRHIVWARGCVRAAAGAIGIAVLLLVTSLLHATAAALEGLPNPLITLINTDKARYVPGAPVTIWVDMVNRSGAAFRGTVTLRIEHAGDMALSNKARSIPSLEVGATYTTSFTWTPPPSDYQGYLIVITARDETGLVVDEQASAIDVSSNWQRFPRYGFVTRYDGSIDPYHVMWQLKNYHIDGVQFYDWQWQHHRPVSSAPVWVDIANRRVVGMVVRSLITAVHDYNMVAMNYNLWNGAYREFATDGSGVSASWALYSDPKATQFVTADGWPSAWATAALVQFDPTSSAWQSYIFAREHEVFSNFAFDGWHMDTLGFTSAYRADHTSLWTGDAARAFVHAAKAALGKRLMLNTVGAVSQDSLATSRDVDALYAEMWEWAQNDYNDIAALVERAQAFTNKPLILAGYMNKGAPGPQFNEPSVRLANATIAALGADHIQIGDGNEMLSTEYFPDHRLQMSDSLRAATMDGYHFLTAYQNLLRDRVRRGDNAVAIGGTLAPSRAVAGKIWALSRAKYGVDVVHLVNLGGNSSIAWRDSAGSFSVPAALGPTTVRIYYRGSLATNARLGFASPDVDHGTARYLPYRSGADPTGSFVEASIPSLSYWDMLWLEKGRARLGTLLSGPWIGGPEATPVGWQSLSGSWSVSGGVLVRVASGGGSLQYTRGFDTNNYRIEVDVIPTTTAGNAAVLGRVQFDGGFYQLELKSGTTWAIFKHDGATGTWRELSSGPLAYAPGTQHHLKMTLASNQISGEIDGHVVGTVVDRDSPFYRGSVGLRSESQLVSFGNVTVTGVVAPPMPN